MKKALFATPSSPKNPRASSISHLLEQPPRVLPSPVADDAVSHTSSESSDSANAAQWPPLGSSGLRRHMSSVGNLQMAFPICTAITAGMASEI